MCRMPRPPLDRRIVRELQKLTRRGETAAEIRRLCAGKAAQLGVPRPSYSTVLRVVRAERRRIVLEARRASPLDSLVRGRVPTPYELEQFFSARIEP